IDPNGEAIVGSAAELRFHWLGDGEPGEGVGNGVVGVAQSGGVGQVDQSDVTARGRRRLAKGHALPAEFSLFAGIIRVEVDFFLGRISGFEAFHVGGVEGAYGVPVDEETQVGGDADLDIQLVQGGGCFADLLHVAGGCQGFAIVRDGFFAVAVFGG